MEKQLEYFTNYGSGYILHVTYWTEGPEKNRLHDVIVNGTFPLDVADIATNKEYRDLKDYIMASMANNSQSYWQDREAVAA